MTPDEITQQNEAVQEWNRETFSQIRNRYMSLINSPKRSGDGLDSLKYTLSKSFGEIYRVQYPFNRYLIFVHKGVGKGRPIGSNKVRPKPWLTPVLDEQVPKLADIVAAFKSDAAVKRLDIK